MSELSVLSEHQLLPPPNTSAQTPSYVLPAWMNGQTQSFPESVLHDAVVVVVVVVVVVDDVVDDVVVDDALSRTNPPTAAKLS